MKLNELLEAVKAPYMSPLAEIGVDEDDIAYWRANASDLAYNAGDSYDEDSDAGSAIDTQKSASHDFDDVIIELGALDRDPDGPGFPKVFIVAVAQIKPTGTYTFIRHKPNKVIYEDLTELDVKRKFVEAEKDIRKLTKFFTYNILH